MSRVNQVVANTNTIVKKIVVGTPIKSVTPTGLPGVVATHGQILVYDSDLQKFVGQSVLSQVSPLIDSAYINARVDPNLVPEVQVDSNLISTLVDSAYIALRTPAPGIDSAAVQSIIDSAYIQARQIDLQRDSSFVTGIIDSAYILQRSPAPTIDSAAVQLIIDSSYILARSPAPVVDSAVVQSIIDSAYINARTDATVDSAGVIALVDSAYVLARSPAPTIDSAGVLNIVDSAHIKTEIPVLDHLYVNDSNTGILVTKNLVPATSNLSLGSIRRPWKDLYISANSLIIGGVKISADSGSLQVNQVVTDSQGEVVEDAPPVAASFSVSDSDIQAIEDFVYTSDDNTFTLSRTGQDDLTATITSLTDPTINGSLKGPAEFVIDPVPHGDAGGRVTIKGRLFVEGDELITNASTFNMPNAKTIALGGNLDSDIDANAAGITVGGADTYLRYQYVGDRWVTNKAFQAEKLYGKYVGFDSDLGNLTLDNIPEGDTNVYFTNARADARINTVVDDAYVQARQLIPGIDSDAVLALVAGVVDSQYSNTLAELLDDLDSARTLIRGVVDSDYVFARYAAIGGLTSSVSVEPSSFQYVFQPSSSTIVIQDSDRSGNTLAFSPTNVDVHVNGLKLTKGIDYSTDNGSIIFLTTAVDSGDVVVVDASKRQAINFKNALVDSSEVIPTTAAASFDIFNKTSFRFVKYTVTAEVTVGVTAKYQASELLVTHNDTEAFFTEYGVVQAQDSSLGEIDVAVVGSNVRVKFDPTYANTTVKFSKVSL